MNPIKNCTTCIYLDTSVKQSYSKCYRYGCKSPKRDGYIPVWISNDRLLAEVVCTSNWMPRIGEVKQMTIDDWLGGE